MTFDMGQKVYHMAHQSPAWEMPPVRWNVKRYALLQDLIWGHIFICSFINEHELWPITLDLFPLVQTVCLGYNMVSLLLMWNLSRVPPQRPHSPNSNPYGPDSQDLFCILFQLKETFVALFYIVVQLSCNAHSMPAKQERS